MWTTRKFLGMGLFAWLSITVANIVRAKMNSQSTKQEQNLAMPLTTEGQQPPTTRAQEQMNGEFSPNVAIVGQWAFWIEPWSYDTEQRLMAAPYDTQSEQVDFSKRHPVDTFAIGDADVQALFSVLDFIEKEKS